MADKVNIRELALDILLRVTRDGEYSHTAIAGVLEKYQYLDKRDRAFLTRLTESTLENLIQINYVIDQFSKVPVRKMKPVIRCIIQSSVCQMRFMESVPDAAACNEAVRLARKKGFASLSGFVNGVLRSISRGGADIRLPDAKKQPEAYLSVRYSIPEWMIRMWQEEFGWSMERPEERIQMEELMQAFASPAPLTVRVNTQRCQSEELVRLLAAQGVTAVRLDAFADALVLTGVDHLRALPAFTEGLFYVQDTSSILVAQEAAPQEGEFVLDVCAAPGGKAVHIAQLLHGTGHVLARDLTTAKITLLEENIRRCQVTNMQAQLWDATVFDEALQEKADLVIADLPCSGLGVMRRKKDIRYNMTPEKIRELAALQRRMLSVVCRYVKPGGRMIYSTCTVSRQENEDNTAWFLKERQDFSLLGSRQILPMEGGGDGFYIARLQKIPIQSIV